MCGSCRFGGEGQRLDLNDSFHDLYKGSSRGRGAQVGRRGASKNSPLRIAGTPQF